MKEFLTYTKDIIVQDFRDQLAIFIAFRNWVRRNAQSDSAQ